MTAAEMGSAMRDPNTLAAWTAGGCLGVARIWDRSITPSAPASRRWATRGSWLSERPTFRTVSLFDRAPFPRPDHVVAGRAARRRGQALRSGAEQPRHAAPEACLTTASTARGSTARGAGGTSCCLPRWGCRHRVVRSAPGRIIALAADHQLPGDARRLVGEGDSGELGRFASQELEKPGRGLARIALGDLHDR